MDLLVRRLCLGRIHTTAIDSAIERGCIVQSGAVDNGLLGLIAHFLLELEDYLIFARLCQLDLALQP